VAQETAADDGSMRRSCIRSTEFKQGEGMSGLAALSWQNRLHMAISRKLRLPEVEEIQLLNLKAKTLRSLRMKLLSEQFD